MLDDTDPRVREAQYERYRQMTPAERVELAWDLTEHALQVAANGIRSRHPTYSDDEVEWALKRLRVGDEMFRAAWPGAPVLDA
jgi:hypothetical protein